MNFKKLAANASKLLVAVATVMIAVPAFAEGYQVNSQSARQTGMGHTGTALKLGAESMLFNPAGMAFMDSKFDISLVMFAASKSFTVITLLIIVTFLLFFYSHYFIYRASNVFNI